MANDNVIMTPPFRANFPNLFAARTNELSGKDEFSVMCLFDKGADLSALEEEFKRAADAKWGKGKWPKNIRNPLRDQGDKEGDCYVDGAKFINLKSQFQPGLINQKREPIITEEEIYSGVYLRATVNSYAYSNKGNSGVSFGLQNIQKVKDGAPIQGRTTAADQFTAIEADNAEDVFG